MHPEQFLGRKPCALSTSFEVEGTTFLPFVLMENYYTNTIKVTNFAFATCLFLRPEFFDGTILLCLLQGI